MRAWITDVWADIGGKGELPEKDFEEVFRSFDKDGSGTITREEIKELFVL